MNFLKKNMKLMVEIILGMILVSSISVYATYTYFATDVRYRKDENEMNVAQALDELYKNKIDVSELDNLKTSINQTDAVATDIVSGKKAYTKNGLITGTLNPNVTLKVLSTHSYNETLQTSATITISKDQSAKFLAFIRAQENNKAFCKIYVNNIERVNHTSQDSGYNTEMTVYDMNLKKGDKVYLQAHGMIFSGDGASYASACALEYIE